MSVHLRSTHSEVHQNILIEIILALYAELPNLSHTKLSIYFHCTLYEQLMLAELKNSELV